MIKKPIVITNGQLEQIQVGDVLAPIPNIFGVTNDDSVAMEVGGTVYISSANMVKYAKADSGTTKNAIAMCIKDMAVSATGIVQVDGRLTLTALEWDLVTGDTGGLTPGTPYFLSEVTAGRITKIAPTTGFVVRMGTAISTVNFEISINAPIKL